MTEVFPQGPCGVLKSQNNLSNNGHSERAEIQTPQAGADGILFDMKGELTMWKPKASRLSYNLVVILLLLSRVKSRSR